MQMATELITSFIHLFKTNANHTWYCTMGVHKTTLPG